MKRKIISRQNIVYNILYKIPNLMALHASDS